MDKQLRNYWNTRAATLLILFTLVGSGFWAGTQWQEHQTATQQPTLTHEEGIVLYQFTQDYNAAMQDPEFQQAAVQTICDYMRYQGIDNIKVFGYEFEIRETQEGDTVEQQCGQIQDGEFVLDFEQQTPQNG